MKDVNKQKYSPLLVDHFDASEPRYFLFLTDRVTEDQRILALLKKDLEVQGIRSYVVVSSVDFKSVESKDDSTEKILSHESDWRKYIKYNGKECSAIVAFGRSVRILNRSADILPMHFEDELFAPIRYFCGSRFVGGPDKWIYPVADIDSIYPVKEMNSTSCVVWYTRIFRKRLAALLNDEFDLNLLQDELDIRDIIVEDIDTDERCIEILNSLMNSELLALDTETSGFDFWNDTLGTVQLCNDGQHAYFIEWWLLKNHKRLFTRVLKSAKRLTLANAKFDIRFLFANGVTGVYPTDDTCLLAHALNSHRPKGLKPGTWFYCGNYGGYDDALDLVKKKMHVSNYLKIPKEILKEYAGIDPAVTWRQQVALDKWCHYVDEHIPNEKIPEWTIWRFYKEVMIPNLEVNIDAEINGVFFSKPKFEEADATLAKIIDECKDELSKAWNVPKTFKFSSTIELGKLFEKLGWPCPARGADGYYKTDDASLLEYERWKCPGIKTLRRFRSMSVGRNTFVKGWRQFLCDHKDGSTRISPSCNTFGTTSFRHSMNDPNFQQIPANGELSHIIKPLFCPPPSLPLYTVEDEQGNVWTNEEYCRLITKRGPVLFEDLREDDEVIDYDKSYTIYDHLQNPWYV